MRKSQLLTVLAGAFALSACCINPTEEEVDRITYSALLDCKACCDLSTPRDINACEEKSCNFDNTRGPRIIIGRAAVECEDITEVEVPSEP